MFIFLIYRYSKVSYKSLTTIATRCSKLRTLCLNGSQLVCDRGISAVLDLCPLLECLMLKDCYNIRGYTFISSKTTRLKQLDLGGCTKVC